MILLGLLQPLTVSPRILRPSQSLGARRRGGATGRVGTSAGAVVLVVDDEVDVILIGIIHLSIQYEATVHVFDKIRDGCLCLGLLPVGKLNPPPGGGWVTPKDLESCTHQPRSRPELLQL